MSRYAMPIAMLAVLLCIAMYGYNRSAAFRERCVNQYKGEAVAAYVCVRPGSRINVSMEGWR